MIRMCSIIDDHDIDKFLVQWYPCPGFLVLFLRFQSQNGYCLIHIAQAKEDIEGPSAIDFLSLLRFAETK